MTPRLAASVPVFVVLAFCLGCAGPPAQPPTPYINEELGNFPVHPELEYKKGYRYAPQELAGTDFKPTWTGHYWGPRRPENYVAFYLREMKAREWKLRRIIEKINGDKILEFSKEAEGATIKLQRAFNRKTARFACSLVAEIRTLGLQHFSPEENYRHPPGQPWLPCQPHHLITSRRLLQLSLLRALWSRQTRTRPARS